MLFIVLALLIIIIWSALKKRFTKVEWKPALVTIVFLCTTLIVFGFTTTPFGYSEYELISETEINPNNITKISVNNGEIFIEKVTDDVYTFYCVSDYKKDKDYYPSLNNLTIIETDEVENVVFRQYKKEGIKSAISFALYTVYSYEFKVPEGCILLQIIP